MLPREFTPDQLLDALVKQINDGFSRGHAAPREPELNLEVLRQRATRAAMQKTDGSVIEAAKLLGVPKSNLYRWLRKWGWWGWRKFA